MTTILPETGRLNPRLTARRPLTPQETQVYTPEWTGSRPDTVGENEVRPGMTMTGDGLSEKVPLDMPSDAKALLWGNPEKRGPYTPTEVDILAEETPLETAVRLKKIREHTAYTVQNTPMLIAWLRKTYVEEPSARSGLGFILKHCQKGEGCVLAMKHNAVDIVTKIQRYDEYRGHAQMQLLVASIFRRLLECNYTRDAIIYKTDVLRVAFTIAHRFMHSLEHVEAGVNCILQCCRSEICRRDIIDLKVRTL